jgi:hypothetical protein
VTTAAELAALVREEIADALTDPNQVSRMATLRAAAETIFRLAYEEVPGDPKGVDQATIDFLNQINGAMGQTMPDGTDEQVDRIANIWGVAAANAAHYYSAPRADKTWITMLDDRVRDLHVPMHGATVAAGQTFNVGGFPLHYPGEPVGPPEVWINCRCTLDMSLTADAQGGEMAASPATITVPVEVSYNTSSDEARHDGPWELNDELATETVEPVVETALTAVSDTPWSQFSASDYTISQWRRACLLKMPGGDPESKSTYKLPVREPGGALNRNGVHAAAGALGGARGGVNAPPAAKEAARRKLRGLYRQLGEDPPDSLAADAASGDVLLAWPPSTSPPGTHDAPGWITHPRETARIRRYWVRGPGAAKIGWGTPNDLTRCAGFMRKYMVNPRHVWGTCQNMHKEALGYWNPESRPSHRSDGTQEDFEMITAAFTAAAEWEADPANTPHLLPPAEWFENPGLTAATALTIGRDGRVVGHLARWGTCHVGIDGRCIEPPHSAANYAYFRTGEIETREGTSVPVGQITMDTGHAGRGDAPLAAIAHYDNTGAAVADVAAGEDDHGIWVAGAMRPGVSEQQFYVLKATGALSGDWRRIGGNLELVAALAVNVPGYPVPRMELAASAGYDTALVAAGIVAVDPNAVDADRVAIAVLAHLDQREADKARRERAGALISVANALRVEALTAAVR